MVAASGGSSSARQQKLFVHPESPRPLSRAIMMEFGLLPPDAKPQATNDKGQT
jgi:hypothetical protein